MYVYMCIHIYIYIRNIYTVCIYIYIYEYIYIIMCIHISIYIYSIHTYNQPISRLFHWNPACDPCFASQLTCAGGLGGLATRMTCRLIKIESNPWRNRLFGHVDSIDYLRFIWACRHPGFCRFVSFCPSRFQRTACFVHGANPGNAEVWGRLLESYEMVNPHQKTGIHIGKSSIWQCVKTLYPFCSHQNSWDLWMFIPLKMVFS